MELTAPLNAFIGCGTETKVTDVAPSVHWRCVLKLIKARKGYFHCEESDYRRTASSLRLV